jgi:D-inositol-3-phosphate glycosyltransferase
LKVVIVGPAHPYRGGIADTNEALSKALSENGIENEIVTFKFQYPDFLFPGKTQFTDDEKPDGIKITRLVHSLNPLNWIKSARYILSLKPDFVVFRYWIPLLAPCLGFIARRVSKKTKTIGYTDNILPHEQRIGDHAFTKYFIKSCNGYIVMSKKVQEELAQFTDIAPMYFPHPINQNLGEKKSRESSLNELNLETDKRYILFFGLVRKYKGLDLLLQSFSLVKDQLPDVKIVIAGEFYDSELDYRKLIDQLGLNDQVIIHNEFVPHSKIAAYFSCADLLSLTYHSASQSGIVQMSYHFEVPALATDVGSLSEMIDDASGYLSTKNAEDISKNILAHFSSNDRDFSLGLRKKKQELSWNNFVSTFEEYSKSI